MFKLNQYLNISKDGSSKSKVYIFQTTTHLMKKPWIYSQPFAKIYPMYVQKAESKGRTKKEVDKILKWLTGYTKTDVNSHVKKETTCEDFFKSKKLNPKRKLITGSVCGVKVQEVKEKTMREIRYLDKLIDELAKGKDMDKILRK